MAKSDAWCRVLKRIMGQVGDVLDQVEDVDELNERLAGLNLAISDDGSRRLAVPSMSDRLDALFAGTSFAGFRYWDALKTAPGTIVLRDRGGATFTIGNTRWTVMFVDLAAWEAWERTHTFRSGMVPEAARLLRDTIESVEGLQADRKEINDQIKKAIQNAVSHGFSAKAIREVLRRRAMDVDELGEIDSMVDLYTRALDEAPPDDDADGIDAGDDQEDDGEAEDDPDPV